MDSATCIAILQDMQDVYLRWLLNPTDLVLDATVQSERLAQAESRVTVERLVKALAEEGLPASSATVSALLTQISEARWPAPKVADSFGRNENGDLLRDYLWVQAVLSVV